MTAGVLGVILLITVEKETEDNVRSHRDSESRWLVQNGTRAAGYRLSYFGYVSLRKWGDVSRVKAE